jgi:hypothetical protein
LKGKSKKNNESVFKAGIGSSPMCFDAKHKTCPYDIPSEMFPVEFARTDGFISHSYGWVHGYQCTCTCHPENQPQAKIKWHHNDTIEFNQGTFLNV